MAPGVYETSTASIARMRGGHFMVVCCRDVSRPGCAPAPLHICGDVARDRSARTRFDHHHTSRHFSAINISVVNVISTTDFAGTFPGTYCLWAVVRYWAIVMGTGSALGMTRAQTHTSEARSFRRNCNA
jgi:hypothetical protein